MVFFWYLVASFGLFIPSTKAKGCRLWMCDAPDPHALLVHTNQLTNATTILYPDVVRESWPNEEDSSTHLCNKASRKADRNKAVDIPDGEEVIAACPGCMNKLTNFEETSLTLTCSDGRLMNDDTEIHLSDLGCSLYLQPDTKQLFEEWQAVSCGADQGYIFTIGWKIHRKLFIPQVEICFDRDTYTTLYTHHFIHGKYIDAKAVDPFPRRPRFKDGKGGSLFSVDINGLYKQANQNMTLEKLLGTAHNLSEFGRKQKYLSRGHLAPDADFVTEAEQNATFFFGNVVPQWQGFNNGNWKILEGATRNLAMDMEQTLNIWTGTHGVLHLTNDQGDDVPIYLGMLGNQKIVPVPERMWKVVYDPIENQSVVFIGLNDMTEEEKNNNDYYYYYEYENSSPDLCQNVCSEITWVKWEHIDDTKRGKMICCSLEDAKQVISTLPQLNNTSLFK